jgi:hypothetical protein
MKRLLLFTLLLASGRFALFCSGNAADTSAAPRSIPAAVIEDIKTGFNDALGYAVAPLNLRSRERILAVSGVAVSAVALLADREIKRLVEKDDKRIFSGDFEKIPVKYGQVEYGSIFAGGLYGVGLLTQTDGLRITGRLLIQSIVYSGSAVMILRWVFGRTRPFLTDDTWDFNWFEPRFRKQAFPSGHATVSFALSTILSNRIKNKFATVGLFGLAVLDGFYQIYNHQHWLSDVITGGAIGIGTSLYVLSCEERRSTGSVAEGKGLSIIPGIGGFRILYHF